MTTTSKVFLTIFAILSCACGRSNTETASLTADEAVTPVLTGKDSLIVQAYDLAVKTTLSVIKKNGIIRAGREYGGEWTRDISINTRNACNTICPEQAVISLWKVTENNGERIGHQYWDKIIWVPAAYEQYLVTGNEELLAKAYKCSATTMDEQEAGYFDDSYGLFKGASVFNDGISAYEEPVYDPANESGNVLDYPDTYQIKCLSTNCAYLAAYRTLSLMARHFGEESAAEDYSSKAESLRTSIRRCFLDKEGRKLAYLIDQNGDVHHFQEGLGYAFAILGDVVTKDEAASIISNAHVGRYGVPSIWPDFKRFSPERPGRHNNLVWPHVNTFFAEAALKAGNADAYLFELKNLADLAINKSDGIFYEIYNPETGLPDGGWQKGGNLNSSKGQTWCATGFISMVYRGLFGIDYTEAGLNISPNTDLLANTGVTSLQHLKYRGCVIDIKTAKSLFKKGVYVNGKKSGHQTTVSPDCTGAVNIVVYY